ncbi:MAG: ATP-binding protein [Nanoarchaeota archaeon]|nr:ATP-binding protein [Nanoarchaeota archaeon]
MKGQVISGEFGRILIRQKSDQKIELGELLITENQNLKILLQVYDLIYGSQISQQNLELISGLKLEENSNLEFMDANLRNYTLAFLKPMLSISSDGGKLCKTLPSFFSTVREIQKQDLNFLTKPKNPLFIGKLRSGSRLLDFDIFLPGEKVFSHHMLIPASTGKGKSNLCSVMLWSCIGQDYAGILVLDPHDEYYGRTSLGLKDHPEKEKISYYSPTPPPGGKSLKINFTFLKPQHFQGVVNFSDPQWQMMNAYYKKFHQDWISAILEEQPIEGINFMEGTVAVVKRVLMGILNIQMTQGQIFCRGVFDHNAGINTIPDICNELEQRKIVIVDTSSFSGSLEILIGSIITTEIFKKYQNYKTQGTLEQKPVISVVLEEAPRVLGKEVLEKGSNIFSRIAREGRKFKIGLVAITQLPSMIPRQILANMNTKIILGMEMGPERQAIIESASQDLSTDTRNIASLDKGEAIVTSTFSRFAIPVKIPLFKDWIELEKKEFKQDFSGVNL